MNVTDLHKLILVTSVLFTQFSILSKSNPIVLSTYNLSPENTFIVNNPKIVSSCKHLTFTMLQNFRIIILRMVNVSVTEIHLKKDSCTQSLLETGDGNKYCIITKG